MTIETTTPRVDVSVNVNGTVHTAQVEPRMLLVDFIRDVVKLTGTHVGCDSTNCGACTVHLDGMSVKSCTMFAVQADGRGVSTVESLAEGDELNSLQTAFHDKHALQCGYCTPGMLMSAAFLLQANPDPTRDEIRQGLAGNYCRCTGYQFIVDAVEEAARRTKNSEDQR